jgi:heptaprenylglyceryl phosphate synthase
MKIGITENFILNSIKENGTLCFPLIDSQNQINISSIINKLEYLGATGILIGGSSVSDQIELSGIVEK